MSIEGRIRRLEGEHADPEETPAEAQERRRSIREDAARSIERSRREGKEPVFEVTGAGDVLCTHDGRPVTESHETLAEERYWDYYEMGNPGALVYDPATEGFYMPQSAGRIAGELAFSRTRCYLPRFFYALGDRRADPYCISAPERIELAP